MPPSLPLLPAPAARALSSSWQAGSGTMLHPTCWACSQSLWVFSELCYLLGLLDGPSWGGSPELGIPGDSLTCSASFLAQARTGIGPPLGALSFPFCYIWGREQPNLLGFCSSSGFVQQVGYWSGRLEKHLGISPRKRRLSVVLTACQPHRASVGTLPSTRRAGWQRDKDPLSPCLVCGPRNAPLHL